MAVLSRSARFIPTSVLLDRDGTILEDRRYLADPDGVVLLPGAAEGLRRLQAAGLRLVVVSNQSGVARGLISPVALAAVEERFRSVLAAEGVTLAGSYHCPHSPEADCDCRKPRDGMARRAAAELGLDLTRCLVVGDKPADIGLARRLGAPAVLVTTGQGAATLAAGTAVPDIVVAGLDGLAGLCCDPAGVARPTQP